MAKRRMGQARKFMVRLISGGAIQFYENGRDYGIVPDKQATVFLDEHTAAMRARACKVPWNQLVVEELETVKPEEAR